MAVQTPEAVELPVCPECGNVGKNPGPSTVTYICNGPTGELHKRTKMRLREFVMVEREEE